MAYNPNAQLMPAVLTGAPGEVLSVTHWPLSARGLERAGIGATDCLIHFDRIKAGGRWNSRRVYYGAGGFYVHFYRAQGGRVYIAGGLALRVFDCVTYVHEAERDERLGEL